MLLKFSYTLLTTKLLNLDPANHYILTNCSNVSLGYIHFQGQILANISFCELTIIFCEYFHPEGYTTTKSILEGWHNYPMKRCRGCHTVANAGGFLKSVANKIFQYYFQRIQYQLLRLMTNFRPGWKAPRMFNWLLICHSSF